MMLEQTQHQMCHNSKLSCTVCPHLGTGHPDLVHTCHIRLSHHHIAVVRGQGNTVCIVEALQHVRLYKQVATFLMCCDAFDMG